MFEHLNVFRLIFFVSLIFRYLEVLFLTFISDWQICIMAGSNLLEAFKRGSWKKQMFLELTNTIFSQLPAKLFWFRTFRYTPMFSIKITTLWNQNIQQNIYISERLMYLRGQELFILILHKLLKLIYQNFFVKGFVPLWRAWLIFYVRIVIRV